MVIWVEQLDEEFLIKFWKKKKFFMPCQYRECICETDKKKATQNTTGISVEKQQEPERSLAMSSWQTQADHVLQEKEVHSGIINTSCTLSLWIHTFITSNGFRNILSYLHLGRKKRFERKWKKRNENCHFSSFSESLQWIYLNVCKI